MEVSLSENNLQLKQINQSLRVYLLKRSSESSSILLEDLQVFKFTSDKPVLQR